MWNRFHPAQGLQQNAAKTDKGTPDLLLKKISAARRKRMGEEEERWKRRRHREWHKDGTGDIAQDPHQLWGKKRWENRENSPD